MLGRTHTGRPEPVAVRREARCPRRSTPLPGFLLFPDSIGVLAHGEVAVLVENAVVGEQHLVIDADDPFVEDGRGIGHDGLGVDGAATGHPIGRRAQQPRRSTPYVKRGDGGTRSPPRRSRAERSSGG